MDAVKDLRDSATLKHNEKFFSDIIERKRTNTLKSRTSIESDLKNNPVLRSKSSIF